MEKIDIVNLFIRHPSENKILVIKRSATDDVFGDMYALPGGKVEKDETLEIAAQREMFEETGVRFTEIEETPFIVSPLSIGDKTYNIGLFHAKINTDNFNPQDPDVVSVEYVESSKLINSLREHKYPQDQINILKLFFINNGYN